MFNFAFLKRTATGCHGSVGGGDSSETSWKAGENQLRERHHPQIIREVDKSQEESRVDLHFPSTPSGLKSSCILSKYLPLLERSSVGPGRIGFNVK